MEGGDGDPEERGGLESESWDFGREFGENPGWDSGGLEWES